MVCGKTRWKLHTYLSHDSKLAEELLSFLCPKCIAAVLIILCAIPNTTHPKEVQLLASRLHAYRRDSHQYIAIHLHTITVIKMRCIQMEVMDTLCRNIFVIPSQFPSQLY
eukprot:154668_1